MPRLLAQNLISGAGKNISAEFKSLAIEKVHLHLDKPYYKTGEDIWFKAYVIDGVNEIPTLTSGALYIDLVNVSNKKIKSIKLPLLNGVTWGDFKLPDTIAEGRYTIYAYTQWMKNFEQSLFFKKDLIIINKSNKFKPNLTTVNDVDIQLFAEGGTLIEGLPGKIAFKAVNDQGRGEFVNGVVIDNDGQEVTSFQSSHLGMGHFNITPLAGKTYIAKVKLSNGKEKTISFPEALASGYVLSVNASNPDKLAIKVLGSVDLLGKENLHLVAHHNGKVYSETEVKPEKQITAIQFSTKELPSGIVELVLLNSSNLPICERVVFINNGNGKIDITTDNLQPSYNKRTPTEFEINSSVNQKITQGSFSIAVTNTALVAPDVDDETHIMASLLLKSDLVGEIEKPNSYFSGNSNIDRDRIDNLMLTQGWRKTIWKYNPKNTSFKPNFPAEKNLKISGMITKAGKPVAKAKISIISTPTISISQETVSDENGKFNFENFIFLDGTQFVIKAETENGDKKLKIAIENIKELTLLTNKSIPVEDSVYIQILNRNKELSQESRKHTDSSKNLREVEIVGKANKAPNSANLNGAGKADAVFDAEDLKTVISLRQYLEGRVSGITLYDQKFYLTRSNPGMESVIKINPPQPMQIYLDGSRIDEIGNIDDITVNNIESVEILKSIANSFVYGTNDGVILITTKTAEKGSSDVNTSMTDGFLKITPKGYSIGRAFYSPKYTSTSTKDLDYRTTVFWEPNLITDKDGKGKISYFNTDVPGIYRMVIEGIDADGNLARKVLTYEVK